jgi:hypothetical protein
MGIEFDLNLINFYNNNIFLSNYGYIIDNFVKKLMVFDLYIMKKNPFLLLNILIFII